MSNITNPEYAYQYTTHYMSDYDAHSDTLHLLRKGTNDEGHRVTVCGCSVVNVDNSFKGPLTCIGHDTRWGEIISFDGSNYRSLKTLHGFVNHEDRCSACLEVALGIALMERQYDENGVPNF
tara:strand:+ start:46 stop:411 length:366 start_codon:yes stop_codon:yes gene_type:complete